MSDTRALALIASGALRIVEASEHTRYLYADVQHRDDGPTWPHAHRTILIHYGWPLADEWHCECPEFQHDGAECVHVVACKLLFQPQRASLSVVRDG